MCSGFWSYNKPKPFGNSLKIIYGANFERFPVSINFINFFNQFYFNFFFNHLINFVRPLCFYLSLYYQIQWLRRTTIGNSGSPRTAWPGGVARAADCVARADGATAGRDAVGHLVRPIPQRRLARRRRAANLDAGGYQNQKCRDSRKYKSTIYLWYECVAFAYPVLLVIYSLMNRSMIVDKQDGLSVEN